MISKTLTLNVDELDKDHLESIRVLAEEIHSSGLYEDDIFKSTIAAVFQWIEMSLHGEETH